MARSSAVRALAGALLAGAVGCGANAGGVAQSSGALEPQSAAADRSGSSGGEREASSDDGRGAGAGSDDARGAGSGDVGGALSLPSERPITEPPGSAPLPTPVLETDRPVNSSEPADVIVPPGDCRFVYLGRAVHCDLASGASVVQADATDLLSCMRQCLRSEGCGAVTDYLYLGQPELGCFLLLSACDDTTVAEEPSDAGGHDFRRVCDD